jgi:hypothetical protein
MFYIICSLKYLIPIINTIKLSKATYHIIISWNKLTPNKTNLKRKTNIIKIISLFMKYFYFMKCKIWTL